MFIVKKSLKIPNGVVKIWKLKNERQLYDQKKKNKQRSLKHYTENYRLRKKNSTQNRWWTIFVSRVSKERNIYVTIKLKMYVFLY
jgi:hypothetical protein